MNIKEIAKNIRRDIVDAFKQIDSNPEHIAGFPAHVTGCSRTKPLNISYETRALPSLYGPNFGIASITTWCPECKGSVVNKNNKK